MAGTTLGAVMWLGQGNQRRVVPRALLLLRVLGDRFRALPKWGGRCGQVMTWRGSPVLHTGCVQALFCMLFKKPLDHGLQQWLCYHPSVLGDERRHREVK